MPPLQSAELRAQTSHPKEGADIWTLTIAHFTERHPDNQVQHKQQKPAEVNHAVGE